MIKLVIYIRNKFCLYAGSELAYSVAKFQESLPTSVYKVIVVLAIARLPHENRIFIVDIFRNSYFMRFSWVG